MSNLLPEIPVFDPGGRGMSGTTSAGQGQHGVQANNSTVLHPPVETTPGSSWVTSAEIQKILQENEILRERMRGLQSLGLLLNESQAEALRLRQRVEDLGRESPPNASFQRCRSPNSSSSSAWTEAVIPPGISWSKQYLKFEGSSSKPQPPMHEVAALQPPDVQLKDVSAQMQRLEDSIIHCATELAESADAAARGTSPAGQSEPPGESSDVAQRAQTDLSEHFARLAHKFHQLSGVVKQNSQKTSCMQVLCEKLATENQELKKKLEGEGKQQHQTTEARRRECERPLGEKNDKASESESDSDAGLREFHQLTAVASRHNQTSRSEKPKMIEKADKALGDDPAAVEVLSQKVRTLERQRKELLEVNKQWDEQFRTMKQQYEAKVVELRGRLSAAQKQMATAGEGQERRQREYDRTLVVAKNRLDREELERERLRKELAEEKKRTKTAQEQLEGTTRHKDLLEREVWRLNQSLAELLAVSPSCAVVQESAAWHQAQAGEAPCRQEDLRTQIAVMRQQLKIYEEDFQKERCDRERMNAEKEELRLQMEQKVTETGLLRAQLTTYEEDYKKEREEKERLQKQLRGQRQALDVDHPLAPMEATWTEPYGEYHYVVRYPPGDPRAVAAATTTHPPASPASPRSPAHVKFQRWPRDQRAGPRPPVNPVMPADMEVDGTAAGSPENQR
ncbi:TNFAIP3-interacting protein 1 isoform X1 [Lampetra fluviatilis]